MNREFLPFERWLKWIQNCFSECYAAHSRTAQTCLLIFKGRCVESRAEEKRARVKWGRKTGLRDTAEREANAWVRVKREKERARKKKSNTSSQCYSFSFEPLNPEWLPMGRNSLSALCVCVSVRAHVSVCVHVCERKTKRVCPRLHQQFKPLISPPQHPSVLHPVLFTPHLFPSISPPPGHHPAVSPGRLFTLPG